MCHGCTVVVVLVHVLYPYLDESLCCRLTGLGFNASRERTRFARSSEGRSSPFTNASAGVGSMDLTTCNARAGSSDSDEALGEVGSIGMVCDWFRVTAGFDCVVDFVSVRISGNAGDSSLEGGDI